MARKAAASGTRASKAPHLREERVARHGRVGHELHAGHRSPIGFVGREGALREDRRLRPQATLAQRHLQELQEGALAHHDLARPGVGFGQQAGQVAVERDLVGLAQVDAPGLQVVRVRRQQRMGHGPAARVGLSCGVAPGGGGGVRQGRAAAGGSDDDAAAGECDEGSTLHGGRSAVLIVP
jgi:hypothetical protein